MSQEILQDVIATELQTDTSPFESGRPNTVASPSLVKRYLLFYLVIQDAVLMLMAMYLALILRFGSLSAYIDFGSTQLQVQYPQLALLVVPIWLGIFYFKRLYEWDQLFLTSGSTWKILESLASGLVAILLGSYTLKMQGISRAWILISLVLATLMIVAGRWFFGRIVQAMQKRGLLQSRTLIVGSNDEARLLFNRLQTAAIGFDPVGYVAANAGAGFVEGKCNCFGNIERIRSIIREKHIANIVIASSAFDHEEIIKILRYVRGLRVDVHISSGLFEILTSRVLVKDIVGIPMTTVKPVAMRKIDIYFKRAFDLFFSILAFFALAPFMVLLAAAIKSSSKGPILFNQERIGRDGKPFLMHKLRSMKHDNDDSSHRERIAEQIAMETSLVPENKSRNTFKTGDERITRVGNWLRKYSIDEIPQLINVMKGEMSLIGPRPPIPYEVEIYEDWMKKRFEVQPGLTGLWQISGRADLPYKEMIKLDIFYIENWSLRLDFSIMLRTIPVVLFQKGAY